MRELSEEHRTQMAEDAEFSRLRLNTGLSCHLRDQAARNVLEELFKDDYVVFVFTPYRVAGLQSRYHPFSFPLWDGCAIKLLWKSPLFRC